MLIIEIQKQIEMIKPEPYINDLIVNNFQVLKNLNHVN